MRSRRRIALLLASAGALAVGLIAFPSSAAAAPPVVPVCAFPATPGSDSCGTLRVSAVTGGLTAAYKPIRLGVRVRSRFEPATSETTRVTLRFDDDIALNLAGIPNCPAGELTGLNIEAAWEQCGPGADGTPASEGNAFLSTGLGAQVSGFGSTVGFPGFPNGVEACTMIFKGAQGSGATANRRITIYARAPVFDTNPAGGTDCDNPATNEAGSATVLFTGNLSRQTSGPYDWTLQVLNTDTADPSLDDFSATIVRGAAFRARCGAGVTPHRMQGEWDYTAPGDANDLRVATDPCP